MDRPPVADRRQRCRRSLHLIDLENLCGASAPSTPDLHYVLGAYRRQVGIADGDSAVVATDRHLAERALFVAAPLGLRFLIGTGPSGADRSLTDSVDVDWLARRFDRLVVASGDGWFTSLAGCAAAAGVHVVQIGGRGGVSRALVAASAESQRVILGPPRQAAPAALISAVPAA